MILKGWVYEKLIFIECCLNGFIEYWVWVNLYSWENGVMLGKFNLILKFIIDRMNWLMNWLLFVM